MKGLNILIVSLLISSVSCDHHIQRSNHIQRYAGKVSDSSGSDEELVDQKSYEKCKMFVYGSDTSSMANPKIQFEIVFLNPIRHMEVNRFSVAIYNFMSSIDHIDVEMSIPSTADNSKFLFFDNKIDKKNIPGFTTTKTIPHNTFGYASFYIQTADKVEITDFINITIKVAVKSENYECYLTVPVRVEPPRVKIYHNNEKTFDLVPTRQPITMPVTAYNPNNSTAVEDIRKSVKITGSGSKSGKTDFSVKLSNGRDFNKVVHVTDTNKATSVEVTLPKNAKNIRATINGTGTCSITVVTEHTASVRKLNSKFNLNIIRLSLIDDVTSVRVCATYNPTANDKLTLSNVIYDARMQCEHDFEDIVDKSGVSDVKVVEQNRRNSGVQIFFKDFEGNKNYCVDIRAKYTGRCYHVKDSVFTVYDNNIIENLAAGYHNLAYESVPI